MQSLVHALGASLYQGMLGFALLYLLLSGGALELRASRLLWFTAATALVTRDTFWIYLLVVSALNWRTILGQRRERIAVALLWAIPVGWLLAIGVGFVVVLGRMPQIPLEWPLMNQQHGRTPHTLSQTLHSLWLALEAGRLLWPILGLSLAWVVGRVGIGFGAAASPATGTEARRDTAALFLPFSLASLAIIFGMLLMSDPWRPIGNPRLAAPLVPHLYIWAVLLVRATQDRPPGQRRLVAGVVLASVLLTVSPESVWLRNDHSSSTALLNSLRQRIDASAAGAQPTVCMEYEDYYNTMARFIAATLYAKRRFVHRSKGDLSGCDVVIAQPGHFSPRKRSYHRDSVELAGIEYAVFMRR